MEFFVDLALTPGDDANVEAFPRKFLAHGEANTVGASRDDGPTVTLDQAFFLETVHAVCAILLLATRPAALPPEHLQEGEDPEEELNQTDNNSDVDCD